MQDSEAILGYQGLSLVDSPKNDRDAPSCEWLARDVANDPHSDRYPRGVSHQANDEGLRAKERESLAPLVM